jgi:hypothetical protein
MNQATVRTLITIIWIAVPVGCLIIAATGKVSGAARVVLVVVALLLFCGLAGCFYLGQQFSQAVQ